VFRGTPGISEVEVVERPVDESRAETEGRIAAGRESAFIVESRRVVEVGV